MLTGGQVMERAARLARLQSKQIMLLKELAVSLEVQAQVPAGTSVRSLRFDAGRLSFEERAALRAYRMSPSWASAVLSVSTEYSPAPVEWPWLGTWIDLSREPYWYNVAVLHDGTEFVLPLMVQAAHCRVLPDVHESEVGDGVPVASGG